MAIKYNGENETIQNFIENTVQQYREITDLFIKGKKHPHLSILDAAKLIEIDKERHKKLE